MSDKDESIGHALLALGIVCILVVSICVAWCIVMCERSRRKRKYRPGQQSQNVTATPRGIGIIRTGASPQIHRNLLVPKAKEHLVIANKAFLSKSTPHLLLEVEDVEPWDSPSVCGSAPLLDDAQAAFLETKIQISPSKKPREMSTFSPQSDPRQPQPHHSRSRPGVPPKPQQPQIMKSKSQPALFSSSSDPFEFEFEKPGLSIHEQIAAILGTFPNLKFTSSKDTLSETKSIQEDPGLGPGDGPESTVDDDEDDEDPSASEQKHPLISVTVIKHKDKEIEEYQESPKTSGRVKRPMTLDFEFPPPLQLELETDADESRSRLNASGSRSRSRSRSRSPSVESESEYFGDTLLETTL